LTASGAGHDSGISNPTESFLVCQAEFFPKIFLTLVFSLSCAFHDLGTAVFMAALGDGITNPK
jgi:hypothetical protein